MQGRTALIAIALPPRECFTWPRDQWWVTLFGWFWMNGFDFRSTTSCFYMFLLDYSIYDRYIVLEFWASSRFWAGSKIQAVNGVTHQHHHFPAQQVSSLRRKKEFACRPQRPPMNHCVLSFRLARMKIWHNLLIGSHVCIYAPRTYVCTILYKCQRNVRHIKGSVSFSSTGIMDKLWDVLITLMFLFWDAMRLHALVGQL